MSDKQNRDELLYIEKNNLNYTHDELGEDQPVPWNGSAVKDCQKDKLNVKDYW